MTKTKKFKFGEHVTYRKHKAIVLQVEEHAIQIAEKIGRYVDVGWTSSDNLERGWKNHD